jgi:hypothetical protein
MEYEDDDVELTPVDWDSRRYDWLNPTSLVLLLIVALTIFGLIATILEYMR